MPWMPSLARVMPAISGWFIAYTPWVYLSDSLGRAVLGIAVAVILEHLLDVLGLEFAVRTLGDLGEIEVLDRVAVAVEFEAAAQRGEVSLLQCRRHCLLVGEIAAHGLDRA